MAGTMKEIAENNEKLHRLQMINTILRNMSSYVDDVVSRLEDEFDDCEDFDDCVTESVLINTRENIDMLIRYINQPNFRSTKLFRLPDESFTME